MKCCSTGRDNRSEVTNLMFLCVSVPPKPQNPPFLNNSGPYHLVVQVNKDLYTGDGPVTSVKLTYKQANASKWETVEGISQFLISFYVIVIRFVLFRPSL